jgi:NitT/TauT family transport system permease protein
LINKKIRNILAAALLPGIVIGLWALGSAKGYIASYLMPAPWDIAVSFYNFLISRGQETSGGGFIVHASATLYRVGLGFTLAVLLGLPLGIISGRSSRFASILDPSVQLLRSVPGISWLPLAIIWFGIGTTTSVFLISLAAFFPIYLNTMQGVHEVPTVWLQTGRMLGAKRSIAWKVIIPAAMPSIETGLRLAMGVSWAYVVLGELTGVNTGLGAIIMDARIAGDPSRVIIGMISIALLGRLSDLLLIWILGRLPGHRKEAKAIG